MCDSEIEATCTGKEEHILVDGLLSEQKCTAIVMWVSLVCV
jgi:hypothetical protein